MCIQETCTSAKSSALYTDPSWGSNFGSVSQAVSLDYCSLPETWWKHH